jgi:hypothetical protein
MTSIERARRFIENKGRALALTTVPLACLVVAPAPLKSSAVFEQAACVTSTSGGQSFSGITCGTSQLPTGGFGVTGVKMFGTGTAVSSGFFTDLLFSTQGTATGSFVGDIPVSYDFTIDDPSGDKIDWEVFFSAFGDANANDSVNGISTGGETTGSFDVPFDGSTITQYVLHLNVMFDTGAKAGDTITVTIPDNSIDVNPVPASTVPEPGTLGLFGSALAGMGLFAWLRRKTRTS